ncbi:MAG: lipopolysaccharide biosynthesis protein [Deltaproteobacteria bacterium]|nr:lipopolysaccharide biosynthesis protein [Deltaproteobacteria bacterium]MBN2688018.1 lipopolysaccharide biosynthesis protein [Deltaproteobacteria bacterium]
MTDTDFRKRTIESVKWSYAGVIVPKLITPLIYIVLAKFLAPKDFGLIAIASLVISLIEMTRDAGISRAVIQSSAGEREIFNISFIMNVVLGVIFFVIVYVTAPLIARFFESPAAESILRVMGIQIILSSFSLSYQSIIQKRIDFRKLFFVTVVPGLSLVLITLPMAYFEYGAWAIVFGNLGGSLSRALSLFIALPWMPRLEFDYQTLRRMVWFGLFCYLEALLGWIYIWGDKAIVGKFVTASALGVYSFAYTATSSLIGLFISPVAQIMFPYLCKESQRGDITPYLYRMLSFFSVISLLIGLMLYHLASALPVFLGEQWSDLVFPFGLLGISGSLSAVFTYIIPDGIKAIGRADTLFRFQLYKLLYTLPLYVAGAYLGGVDGFCIARLITVVIGSLLFCWLAVRHLRATYAFLWRSLRAPFIGFFCSFFILMVMKQVLAGYHEIAIAGLVVTVGFLSYLLVLKVLDRTLIAELWSYIVAAFHLRIDIGRLVSLRNQE